MQSSVDSEREGRSRYAGQSSHKPGAASLAFLGAGILSVIAPFRGGRLVDVDHHGEMWLTEHKGNSQLSSTLHDQHISSLARAASLPGLKHESHLGTGHARIDGHSPGDGE